MAHPAPHDGLDAMTGGPSMLHLPFELGGPVTMVLEQVAIFIDLIGVSVILVGFVVAFLKLMGGLRQGLGLAQPLADLKTARTTLGIYILTGLEFMIASDIVHTVITREFSDLIFVGLLVVIRTAISFFLGKEVMELEHHRTPKAEP